MTKWQDSSFARATAYAMSVIGLVFIAFEIVTILSLHQDVYCGPGDKVCLRDWIGATSGWAAAMAAGITVWVMQAQTWQAERHHQAAIERDAAELDRVAEKAFNLAHDIMTEVLEIKPRAAAAHAEPSIARDGFLAGAIASLELKISSQDLDDFEAKLGKSRALRDRFRAQLTFLRDLYLERVRTRPYDFNTLEPAIEEFMNGLEPLATDYFREVGRVHLTRVVAKTEGAPAQA